MGYDLEIYSHIEPGVDTAALLEDTTDFERSGIEVDGPLRVEPDDVPDAVSRGVLSARWTFQLHLGRASDPQIERGQALARELADHAQGVVYDPQTAAVIWPHGPEPSSTPAESSGLELIRLVKLDWCFPRPLRSADALRLLTILRETAPAMMPRRYGTTEPLQGAFDGDEDRDFAALWDRREPAFWTSTSPCFGGSLIPPRKRRAALPPELHQIDVLSTTFDGRTLDVDGESSSSVFHLFAAVAETLGSFYAAGSVERNIRCARNNRVAYGPEAERHVVAAGIWLGLPPFRTWLTWFGPPYAELRALLPERGDTEVVVDHRSDGVLMRLGATPKDDDELQRLFPSLPPELIRPGGHTASSGPADTVPDLSAFCDGP